MLIDQISVFVENTPGKAAEVIGVLSAQNINVRALSLTDAARYGLLHLVVDDAKKACEALRAAQITASVTKVLAIKMPDSPGGLYHVLNTVGQKNINVEYAYAFVSPVKGSAIVILRVEEPENAEKVLNASGMQMPTREELAIV